MIGPIGILALCVGIIISPRLTLGILVLCLGYTIIGILMVLYAVVFALIQQANN